MAHPPAAPSGSSGAASVDVVIIGAGIVGAAAASEVAHAGASVLLIDATGVAAGASGRNSGAVWHPLDPVLEVLYLETLDQLRALPDDVAAVVEPGDAARSFGLASQPVGILTLGRDEDGLAGQAAELAATHPQLRPTFLPPRDLQRVEPSIAPGLAALRLDIGFPVAPWAATQAYAALARAGGAALRTGGAATVIRTGARATGVSIGDERIAAGAVLVAAGPWTPGIVDPSGAWRPIRPFWGVVVDIALETPPHHIVESAAVEEVIGPAGADEAADVIDFSLVTADGRSALGSTFLAAEPDPAAYVERLREGGSPFVPAIADAPILGRRACARPLSRDGRPLVGRVPGVDGLFVAAGHGPWGLSTGAASGRHIARLILGDETAVPASIAGALDPGRFGSPPS